MTGGAAKVRHRHAIGQSKRVALGYNRAATGDIAHPGNGLTFNKDAGAVWHDGGGAVPFDRANMHVANAGGNQIAHGQSSFLCKPINQHLHSSPEIEHTDFPFILRRNQHDPRTRTTLATAYHGVAGVWIVWNGLLQAAVADLLPVCLLAQQAGQFNGAGGRCPSGFTRVAPVSRLEATDGLTLSLPGGASITGLQAGNIELLGAILRQL